MGNVSISLNGSTELNAVLYMWTHQGRAEREENLPQPTGHPSFDVLQDTISLLGHKDTLPAYGQSVIHQDT